MKKFLTVIVAVLALFATAEAREIAAVGDDASYCSEEFSLSYGRGSVPGLATTLGAVFGGAFSFGHSVPSKIVVLGTLSGSYQHRFSQVFSLGCDATVEMTKLSFKVKSGTDENGNAIYEEQPSSFTTYAALMPCVRFCWFSRPRFGIYAKAAGGVCLQHVDAIHGTDKDGNEVNTPASSSIAPAYQLTPIGLEFGGRIKGFTELGFGYEGMLLAGLRYCF